MGMISLSVPEDIRDQLAKIKVPGKKESKDEYHITLFYFENKLKIDDILKVLETAFIFCKKHKSFPIKGTKIESFPEGDDGFPIIVPIESDDLQQFRKKLAKKFDADGIDYSKRWPDFNPHLTLSYSSTKEEKPLPKNISWEIDEIELWAGDDMASGLYCSIPLGISKHATRYDNLYAIAELLDSA